MKKFLRKSRYFSWFFIPVLISGAILFTAFSMQVPQDDPMPGADAEELWTFITEEQAYEEWDQWPGKEGMYEGQSPHGKYLKLYVNEITNMALQHDNKEMPLNAIIVKENYDENKNLVAITPMYKVDGYNPEAGDWFWAKYGTDGKVMASGKVKGCIECHNKVKDNDYVFNLK